MQVVRYVSPCWCTRNTSSTLNLFIRAFLSVPEGGGVFNICIFEPVLTAVLRACIDSWFLRLIGMSCYWFVFNDAMIVSFVVMTYKNEHI